MTLNRANILLPFELALWAAEAGYRETAPTGWDGVPCAALVDAGGQVVTATDMARAGPCRRRRCHRRFLR